MNSLGLFTLLLLTFTVSADAAFMQLTTLYTVNCFHDHCYRATHLGSSYFLASYKEQRRTSSGSCICRDDVAGSQCSASSTDSLHWTAHSSPLCTAQCVAKHMYRTVKVLLGIDLLRGRIHNIAAQLTKVGRRL